MCCMLKTSDGKKNFHFGGNLWETYIIIDKLTKILKYIYIFIFCIRIYFLKNVLCIIYVYTMYMCIFFKARVNSKIKTYLARKKENEHVVFAINLSKIKKKKRVILQRRCSP